MKMPNYPCPHCGTKEWMPKLWGWACTKCHYFTDWSVKINLVKKSQT